MSYDKEVKEFVKQCEKITTTYYDAYSVERVVSLVDVVDGLLGQFDLEQLEVLPKLLSARSEDLEFGEASLKHLLADHVSWLVEVTNDGWGYAEDHVESASYLLEDAHNTLEGLKDEL